MKLKGRVEIWKVGKGERVLISNKSNQIVLGGLKTAAELFAQAPGTNPAHLALHSLWIEASDTPLPAAASVDDTGPTGAVIAKYVFNKTVDVTPNVGGVDGLLQLRGILAADEGVGATVRAICLYTRGDAEDPDASTTARMVARQLVGATEKEAGYALHYHWFIEFYTED